MKTKLAIIAIIMLGSSGCVTTNNSYTRDIVYRDGSYYSPADEQYGDYYYEPEPDYSYYDYDDYYPGYGFSGSWYGSSRCRFSYYYDRYCDNGWGGISLGFSGFSLFIGGPSYYGYGGYPYYGSYPYYGYGWHSPRPRPRHDDARPMPKPTRPGNPIPDYGFSNDPGMRVPGEPLRMPTKPGLLEAPAEPVMDDQASQNADPYASSRTRQPYRPNIRPERPQNNRDDTDSGIVIGGRSAPRMRTKPAFVSDDANGEPARQNRRPQPYFRQIDSTSDGRTGPLADNPDNDGAPTERVRRDNRQERQAPRVERSERVERAERVERVERAERSERPIQAPRRESRDDSNGGN